MRYRILKKVNIKMYHSELRALVDTTMTFITHIKLMNNNKN